MPANAWTVAQLADDTEREITGSHERWTAFLTTAARLYKYPYREQLMIFAQRPEATACAEYNLWNKTMRRYVRRGSKGIALVDTSGEVPRIRYVFDVADTGARHDSLSPFLWKLEDQHMNAVHDALENRYGADDFMMADQLEHIAIQLSMEYWEEHRRDILDIVDGSFLAEYDEFNVGVSFRSAAAISISYALLSRCGLEPEEQYNHEDFLSVFDWNTPDAANALGTAVSQISEQVLRQIEVTVRNYERSVEHERDSVSAERGLSDPGDHPGRTAPAAPGQVRQDAEEVPTGAAPNPVQPARPERPAAEPPVGNRGNGQQKTGADDERAGGEERRDGGIESKESDGLGGPDERPQESSGRSDPGGTDLRIAETVEQTSLFPSEIEQQKQIENMVAAGAEREKSSVLVLSDEEIEHVLCHGSGYEDGKLRIAAFYASHPSPKAAQDFLKGEYGVGGHSHTYLSGMGGFVDYDRQAMRLSSRGYKEQMRMTWTVVEKRVRDMIENGRYLSADEQARFDEMMRSMAGREIPVPVPRAHYPPVSVVTVIGESTLDLPASREINRGEIEAAIQEWNGSIESKIAVSRAIRDGHSTEETAALMRREYGDDLPVFPVTVEGTAADIPWTRVSEIACEMVKEDRFFTDDERGQAERLTREADAASKYKLGFGFMGNGMTVWNELEYEAGDYKIIAHVAPDRKVTFYDDNLPENVKARIIYQAETSNDTVSATQNDPVFSTPPRQREQTSHENISAEASVSASGMAAREYTTPNGIPYHVGDEMDWYTGKGEPLLIHIDHIDDESLYVTLPGREKPFKTKLNRESVDLQIDSKRFVVRPHEPGQEEQIAGDTIQEANQEPTENLGQSVLLPLSEYSFEQYNNLKRQYPDTIIGFELDSYFEFYGEDARKVAEICNGRLVEKMTPAGQTIATGFPIIHWPSNMKKLWSKGNNVYLAGENADGTHSEVKHLLGQDYLPINAIVHLDDREYRIEQVDFQQETVTLRNLSEKSDARFPLFRQESTETVRDRLEEEPIYPPTEEIKEKTFIEPLFTRAATEYNALKARYPNALIGFEQHGEYEFYGEDAILAASILGTKKSTKAIPGKHVEVTSFPVSQWQTHLRALWSYFNDVYLASEKPDGTHEEKKYLRKEDYIPLNAKMYLNGREYRVASVDYEHRKVSVQDMTMLRESNYPLFREFSASEARIYLENNKDFPLLLESDVKHAPELDEPESTDDMPPEKPEETGIVEGKETPAEQENTPPLRSGERLIPAHDGIPAMRELVIDLTGRYSGQKKKPDAPVREAEAVQSAVPPAVNFRITDDHLGEGGQKTKYANNVAAIRTLKAIEAENRHATPEEQEILSRYVGWGGIPQAFDPSNASWDSEFSELAGLLNDEEYELARASTLNAHYTSPTVIKAMYQALEQMGFRTGNILEPSCGVGNFFGLLPERMQNSKLYGVELDSITGRIAKQLYPQAQISVTGFEKTDRRDFFDVAVGNVPFGSYKLADKRLDKHNFLIHDYFFAKALDQVRPGGVIAFITSKGTMDKQSDEVRKYIAKRADLLGAIRLPNNAFKANAGTEVTSDILFLQKREQPLDIEPEWVHLSQTEDGIPINSYFSAHPEMVLGKMAWDDSMYGNQKETACLPLEGADLSQQLAQAVQYITGEYHTVEAPDLEEGEKIQESIPATPDVKNYSYAVVKDKVYYRENSIMVRPELNETAQERIKGMVKLRDCVHALMDAQLENYSDDAIQTLQGELNRLYDDYTAKYGLISSRANSLAFRNDSSYYLLCSLEVLDEEGNLARKADMFNKRTIRQKRVIDHVDTAVEALAISIGEKAKVDMEYMSSLTGKTEQELYRDLTSVIFLNPMFGYSNSHGDKYLLADEYLSGNIRDKLAWAKRSAELYPEDYTVNVQALEAAMPKDLEASEIEVRLGSTWVDKKYIKDFIVHLLDLSVLERRPIQVEFSSFGAEWHISGKNSLSYNHVACNRTYGTDRANALSIIEDTLNLRDVRIYDLVEDADGKEKRVLNQKETTLAQQKQQMIKNAFQDWIWSDPKRRAELVEKYNVLFNSVRPREYDGKHIIFSGMNPEITLREHQKTAIAHILYGGNTLLAHVVGAGKSFEMAAAAMESKRLGLCQKSLFVVPNHLTEQWGAEFLRLYPSAKILVTTKKDFEKANRKKFCSRIAMGDYDAVIIGHSQFEKIPMSPERQQQLIQDQIKEITDGIIELKAQHGEQFNIKQMERTKKQLKARLEKLQAEEKKDDVVTFEHLGVDRLFVDEAHNYKNMFLMTKMRNVAGLSTSEAQKSTDMYLKCRYMDEITGGRGVVFATGTPISNSMTELYTMQRYLQYDTLRRNNMTHFDCWASTFGETVTAIELAPEGTGYRARTRFARFFNLPELMSMFREIADIKTADQLNLPTPTPHFETVVAQPTQLQKLLVQALSKRASVIHKGAIKPEKDNMLKVTNDGRKLGLDQRLINPLFPDEPQSKVNQCVENVFRIWAENTENRLTQLLFCDISTPKGKTGQKKTDPFMDEPEETEETAEAMPLEEDELDDEDKALSVFSGMERNSFNVYDDIREKLIEKGIPKEEIAFIHEADTEVKKKELFAKVRSGQVRVLLGSTAKMGTGTNVQDRLIAIHDLDCPWRPSDLEQRFGRIVRQGNKNPDVFIYRYVTEGTFDSYCWQTIENKQKFVGQIMTSKSAVRSCEDVDEVALSYAEIKALCAGDNRIKEKMELDVDVARLRLMKADYQNNQYRMEDDLLYNFPREIEQQKGFLAGLQHDSDILEAHPLPKEDFVGITVQGKHFSERVKAGEAILLACEKVPDNKEVEIGEYRGFSMHLKYNAFGNEFILTLRGEMSHSTALGPNAAGNITRIDNALKEIPQRIMKVEDKLQSLNTQIAAIKAEKAKPFPYEAELKQKSERLAELNIALNIDGDRQSPEAEETKAAPKHKREEVR